MSELHTAAEKAARRIAGRTHLPGPFSLHWTTEIVQAAIDTETARYKPLVDALGEIAEKQPLPPQLSPYTSGIWAGQELTAKVARDALAEFEKGAA